MIFLREELGNEFSIERNNEQTKLLRKTIISFEKYDVKRNQHNLFVSTCCQFVRDYFSPFHNLMEIRFNMATENFGFLRNAVNA